VDTDGTTLGSEASAIVLEIERVRPNVVVLCFALDQPRSLSRICSFWLPTIASINNSKINPSWPFLPVCLCGTKADLIITETNNSELSKEWLETRRSVRAILIENRLLKPDAEEKLTESALDTDELADVSTLRTKTLEDILTAYTCVQANAFVSGYYWAHNLQTSSNVGLIDDVPLLWLRATSILIYPVFPLFSKTADNYEGEVLTKNAERAIQRIFRVIDYDSDNLISIDELSVFQSYCFGFRINESELVAYIAQKRESEPDSVRAVGSGDIDASDETALLGLTLSGFTSLFLDHVMHMNSDPDPSAWQILQAFGYKWGTPRINDIKNISGEEAMINQLCLHIPETFTTPPPLPTEDFNASGFFPSFSLPSFPQNPKRRILQLSGTNVLYNGRNRSTLILLSTLCSRRFEGTGIGFVSRLFMRYTYANGLNVVLSSDLDDVFSICSHGEQPFGTLFRSYLGDRDDINSEGISLHSWIHSWQALVACKPHLALVTLFELGFSAPNMGQGSLDGRTMLNLDPRLALEWGHPRTQTKTTSMSSATRRVFVIGSKRCGNTTLIHHFLNSARTMEARVPNPKRDSLNIHSQEVEQIFGAPAVPYGFSGRAPPILEIKDAKIASSLPVTLAITELGEDSFDSTNNTNQGKNNDLLDEADAILLVSNPEQKSSIDFVKKIAQLIPDNIPTACVSIDSSNASSSSSMSSAFIDVEMGIDINQVLENRILIQNGMMELSSLCRKTLLPIDKEIKEKSTTPTMEQINQSSSPSIDDSSPPLCIELFPFSLHDSDANSMTIFEYITALTIFPEKDNPQTKDRRQRAEDKVWKSFFFKTGLVISSAALILLLLRKKKVI
jgi:hypothetical protein